MITRNRTEFLAALRSGQYQKGTTITDSLGQPVIKTVADEGFCAVGLMDTLFNPDFTSKARRDALGLNNQQINKIQQEWNDSSLTFPQIADLVEWEMF
jgi:hypothetical protein